MAVITAKGGPPSRPWEDFGAKVQAHQRYYAADGGWLPGVTTIIGILAKPALVPWANMLGLQGISTDKYVGEAAATGALAHYRIECELKGAEPVLEDYTPAQLARSAHSVNAYHGWLRQHRSRPELMEAQLVSEEHRYGGTIDCYGPVDGLPTLLDFKTSSGIYHEHKIQAAAYWHLLVENGHPVKGIRILRIPRVESEGLEEHVLTGAETLLNWKIFQACLQIYALKKAVK